LSLFLCVIVRSNQHRKRRVWRHKQATVIALLLGGQFWLKRRRRVVSVATEDRALRARTSGADAALQTAGVAVSRQPTGPGRSCRSKPKAKNPRRVRGTESPDSFDNTLNKTENYVSVFSGEVHDAGRIPASARAFARPIDCWPRRWHKRTKLCPKRKKRGWRHRDRSSVGIV
jgi:hypothetical protein